MRFARLAVVPAVGTALCLLPATAGAQADLAGDLFAYDVVKAVGYERVDWEGDQSPECNYTHLCDYSGHISYDFKLAPGESGAFVMGAGGPAAFGGGFFKTRGLTSTYVRNIPSGGICHDRSKFTDDGFTFAPRPHGLEVKLHSADLADVDFMRTHCAGPGESELALARLEPRVAVSVRRLRRHVVRLVLTSAGGFHVGVFRGRAHARVIVVLRRDRRLERAFGQLGFVLAHVR